MSDICTLRFQNFKSIRDATLDLAPLTVLYGANGAGKSSIIQGLLTLRNFLANPEQDLSQLLSYGPIQLGDWKDVVNRHEPDTSMSLSIGLSNPSELCSEFTLTLDQSGGHADLSFRVPKDDLIYTWPNQLNLQVPIPYSHFQFVEDEFSLHDTEFGPDGQEFASIVDGPVIWNGFLVAARLTDNMPDFADAVQHLNNRANLAMKLARLTGYVPVNRGFCSPSYYMSSTDVSVGTEQDVASLLASSNERFRRHDVSRYVEKVTGRRIEIPPTIGSSQFAIDSIPISEGVSSSIVNEGYGINQVVYMLTVCLHRPFKIVAIEEPEIHLHPSMVRKLAIALAEIAHKEDRRLIISTHSETFVIALLSQIAAGNISVDDTSFVFVENVAGETRLTQQKANQYGQIEGGLASFMESEREDLMNFLGLEDEDIASALRVE